MNDETVMRNVITAEGAAQVDRGWMTKEPAAVARAKPAVCTGLIGTRCTCGAWHEAPADGPGLLASPVFWIDGAICLLCWFALYLMLTH